MNGAIDVHTHILPPRWDDWAARFGGSGWPRLVGDPTTQCRLYLGETFNRNLGPDSFDPARRIIDMDMSGIERQVLSPPPPLFCYWADGAAAAEFCRVQNDNIASVVARHPGRFVGAGTLPLQSPDLAVKELERVAQALSFPCVEIGGNVDGRDLDDQCLHPVWEAADALGIAIFVHPAAPVLGGERFRKYNLMQSLGFPLETALCMTRVIYGGLIERWPRLRWCVAHGGGAFPFVLGRVDHGWDVTEEGRASIPRKPSEYMRGIYVDTLTHSARGLRLILDVLGDERVVLGSDYPFRMGTRDPLGALAPLELEPPALDRLRGDNARAFLGMAPTVTG
jgi:aminocarboxymuconate-semialdehyde decarboxylase